METWNPVTGTENPGPRRAEGTTSPSEPVTSGDAPAVAPVRGTGLRLAYDQRVVVDGLDVEIPAGVECVLNFVSDASIVAYYRLSFEARTYGEGEFA